MSTIGKLRQFELPREYYHWLSKESVWGWLFLLPSLLVLGLVSVYPLTRGIYLSFFEYDGIGDPEWVGLDHYATILGWTEFWIVMRNTLVWAFAAVVIMATIGLGFAIMLNREFRGRSIATTLLLLPWAVPFISIALNWRLMYNFELGPLNGFLRLAGISDGLPWIASSRYALFSVMLAWVWRNFPFFMLTFLAGMKGIPGDLYEAARVDGSSKIDSFRHITLPFLQPVVVVMTLLMSLWSLNHFTLIYVMTGGGPGNSSMVLPVYIYQQAFHFGNMGLASAIAVVMLLVMLTYGLIYLRLYREDVGGK
ncbi:carbohydrate ABC transporter permease [Natronorubrum texcoconense]|uniref:Carbohydrate ABC transporter membrane protein 1, CUT1 family n=1 Tax=Natronorubrum texcoconense TaxID=1095776 RepID=A0A1G9CVT8_9EURY|nr:sugar ABC transporter permease [Natronorubrum texcoconense]SDK55798.1 carbohydrate ABC transporter membrane protein 1, CUT1 family [Natronorubrum texcoconense]